MKIIVVDQGWHEYKVEASTPYKALLHKINDLYQLMPDADIYLDWQENAVFVDPESLDEQLSDKKTLH